MNLHLLLISYKSHAFTTELIILLSNFDEVFKSLGFTFYLSNVYILKIIEVDYNYANRKSNGVSKLMNYQIY